MALDFGACSTETIYSNCPAQLSGCAEQLWASSAVRDTDVFRTLGSANSASWDQQLTAVLAERFFERITNGRCNEGSDAPVPLVFPLAQGVQTGLPQDNT